MATGKTAAKTTKTATKGSGRSARIANPSIAKGMTNGAAKPGTGTIARAKKSAKDAGDAMVATAGKIVKGCVVAWTQRTRTGEKTYEGIVQSGVSSTGRRTVKLIPNGETMSPMNKWLGYKGPAPAEAANG